MTAVTESRRSFSRITLRLLVFNILVVFLPVAGILYLDIYEKQLLKSLEDSMAQQARLVSAALSERTMPEATRPDSGKFEYNAIRIVSNLRSATESRLRIVDAGGNLIVDSATYPGARAPADEKQQDWYDRAEKPMEVQREARDNFLYRVGSAIYNFLKKVFLPPSPAADPGMYEKHAPLAGKEVLAALSGSYSAVTRISGGGQRSVTLYVAFPVWRGEAVNGAVLVSQSTYRILRNLYELRLAIFRIFIMSLSAAVLVSFFLSLTIGRPLRTLTIEAGEIVDHRGRMTRTFRPMKRKDEIGDLSQSLVRLTGRIEAHIEFIESFAGDIAHELRNPLCSIRTSAELGLQSADESERVRFFGKILEDSGRLASLIAGVREISVIDTRLLEEANERIDLRELCTNLATGYEATHPGRVTVIGNGTAPLYVKASHYRLTEVLENLIDNAIDFSPAEVPVTITICREGAFARIDVADQGPGIPPGHATKIFSRFFSFRPGAEGKKEHMGLGLAIVKAIVEGYGGSVSVRNRDTDGSVFTVILPLAAGENERGAG